MAIHFSDRTQAGKLLAHALEKYVDDPRVVIYALPRGGVVLGAEVARVLKAPLCLVIARKIGHPDQSEFAIAAVTETGAPIVDSEAAASVDRAWLLRAIEEARGEAARRRQLYLGEQRCLAQHKIAIIVDDGVATGLTLRAAVLELRAQKPSKLIVAIPVAPADVLRRLSGEVDELIVLDPGKDYLGAVGSYYSHFPQVSDEEVIALMGSRSQHV